MAGLAAAAPRDASFQRGVSLTMSRSDGTLSERKALYEAKLDEMVSLGATDLQLVVHWGQADVLTSAITPHVTETINDGLVEGVMQAAKKRGLRVFVLPVLRVEQRTAGKSRASLSPEDVEAWWWSYRRFALHYARLAGANGASLFSVGSELSAMERDAEHWRELIKDVKKYFHGPLTYTARWDHVKNVAFWDALDVVGITGTPVPTKPAGSSDEALLEELQKHARSLDAWVDKQGMKYVFTQFGYPSPPHPGAAGERSVDPLVQLRTYRALYSAWQKDSHLAGIYVWGWSGKADATRPAYSPRKQPAQAVMSHWYKNSRTAPTAGDSASP